MTSKNLFFKLMKEDLKSRIWAVALISLVFFFVFPVTIAFQASDLRNGTNYVVALRNYTSEVTRWLSFSSGLLVFLMMAMALVCGMSSFSYLNSKSKVDFYHSIPVRRETMYFANYINGFLIVAVPYAVMVFLGIIVAVVNRVALSAVFATAICAWALNLTYFALLYGTVILAVMLTGNLVVSFLGVGVLSFIVPIISGLTAGYYSVFYSTYYAYQSEAFFETAMRISPVLEYIYQVANFSSLAGVVRSAVVVGVAAVVMMVISCLLYRKRPSEAAGKAMAFAVSRPIVRIIITIVSALGFGMFFWGIRYSTSWAVFGVLCGGIISHCVIEIIYNFDFKKLFSHPVQLAGCVVVSLAILAVFRYDLTGYDRYIPKAENVKSSAVVVDVFQNWASYGETKQDRDGAYAWESIGQEEYAFDRMRLEDTQTVLQLAEIGIGGHREDGAVWSEEDMESEIHTNMTIRYVLTSGRSVYRTYWIPVFQNIGVLEALYQNEAYKRGAYPVMELAGDQVSAIWCKYGDQEVKKRDLTDSQKKELLEAYQSELMKLDVAAMGEEIPVGLIRFVTPQDQIGLDWVERKNGEKDESGYSRYWDYTDLENRGFYPVYPSFQKTLGLLSGYGIVLDNHLNDLEVLSVKAESYRYVSDWTYATFTDPVEIEELIKVLQPRDILYYNSLCRYEGTDFTVVARETENRTRNSTYVIPLGQMPEFVKERLTVQESSDTVEESSDSMEALETY